MKIREIVRQRENVYIKKICRKQQKNSNDIVLKISRSVELLVNCFLIAPKTNTGIRILATSFHVENCDLEQEKLIICLHCIHGIASFQNCQTYTDGMCKLVKILRCTAKH